METVKNTYSNRNTGVFLLLTFLISWGLAAGYYFSGGRLSSPSALLVLLPYMFAPALAAFITQKFFLRQQVKTPLAISFRWNRWFTAGWLVPIGISLATLGISILLPYISYSPNMQGIIDRFSQTLTPEQLEQIKNQIATSPVHPFWLGLIQALITGVTINAVAGFGEELGWRGFLYKELKAVGFWNTAVVTGIIWGIWHAPLIIQGYNYPQHPLFGVLLMILFTTLYAPIFHFIRWKSGSTVAASIVHGSLNASYGFSILLIQGGNDITSGLMGLPGLTILALINILLYLYLKKIDFNK